MYLFKFPNAHLFYIIQYIYTTIVNIYRDFHTLSDTQRNDGTVKPSVKSIHVKIAKVGWDDAVKGNSFELPGK